MLHKGLQLQRLRHAAIGFDLPTMSIFYIDLIKSEWILYRILYPKRGAGLKNCSG